MAHRSHRKLAAALALASACDTGYNIQVTVNLPEQVAAKYSPEQRGLLFVSLQAGEDAVVNTTVVCGEATHYEFELGGDGERKDAKINAWIITDSAGAGACGPEAQSGVDPDDYQFVGDEPEGSATLAGASGCERDIGSVEVVLAAP